MKIRMHRWLLSIVIISVALLFLSPGSVQAATSGRITGHLFDGTNKNAPLAGQRVTLQMAQLGNAHDLTTTVTDAHGMFSFANLNTDKTIQYAVYIRYEGAQYVSDVVSLDTNPIRQVDVTVYQATRSTAKIAVVQATLLVHAPDAKKRVMTVSEVYSFQNLDTHAFVGSLNASAGKPDALFFSLPTGARNVNLNRSFDGAQVLQVDHGFATDASLPPGRTDFAFSFDVPYTAASYDLGYTALYPTVVLTVMIPTDLHASAGSLNTQSVVTVDNHPYRRLQTQQLLAHQTIHVNLEGLPLATSTSVPFSLKNRNIGLIIGLLIMLAILLITAFIYHMQQRLLTRRGRGGKRSWSNSEFSSRNSQRKRTTSKPSEQEEALMKELLALDKKFEAGKISKATYQERRAKTKARLRALMSERETSRR